MKSKHLIALICDAWRAAQMRIFLAPDRVERRRVAFERLAEAPLAPMRLKRRLRPGDPDVPVPSLEFDAAFREELGARGLTGSPPDAPRVGDDAVLAKAAQRAATYLDLPTRVRDQLLPSRLGASSHDGSDPDAVTDDHERALGLIRLFREIDAILPERDAALSWLRGPNTDLGESPLSLLETGRLDDVLAYLEQIRHR